MTAVEQARQVTVVIVEQCATRRRRLRAAIEAESDLVVVGEARTGPDAVALVARLRPAVVLLDMQLPRQAGLETIEHIMSISPTPILACSTAIDTASAALAAGAVDTLPDAQVPEDRHAAADAAAALRRTLRMCARARVITHPRGRLRAQGLGSASLAPREQADPRQQAVRLIVLGASTGGPHALHALLRRLPADLPQAVLVVQHMAEGFLPGLVAWLDALVPMPVRLGEHGIRRAPGTVTFAPSGGNFVLTDDRLCTAIEPPAPGQFHVPGIDATFTSVARVLGPAAVGVLLTGMGRDGAAGLLQMRTRHARTLAQDEKTSAVYGMPAAAAQLDAVDRQLPLDELAAAVLEAVGRT